MTTIQKASKKNNGVDSDIHSTRNPRSVDDRRSHQCARLGWRPRKRTPRQLARDIAESIRQHRAAGDARWTEPRDFTPDVATQALVRQLLAADAAPQPEEDAS